MFYNSDAFQTESDRFFEDVKALWPIDAIYLFLLEDGTLTTCYSSNSSGKDKRYTIPGLSKTDYSILFSGQENPERFGELSEGLKLNRLDHIILQEDRAYYLGVSWNSRELNPGWHTVVFKSYNNLCDRFFLQEKIKNENVRTRQIISEVGVLHEISRAFEGSKSLDSLLHYLVEKAQFLMRTESASLMLHLEDTDELEFKVVLGPKSEEVKPFRLAMGKGIAGWVAKNQEPILIPNAYDDPRFDPSFDKRSGYVTRSILCVPMIHKGKTVGVMTVLNRQDNNPFVDDDKTLMFTFASQAALAIENARLLHEALEKERIDSELQVASEIQNLLIPHQLPDISSLSICATYKPCKEVSGDFYDVIKLDERRAAFVVADVAGKGIPGAMLVSTMQAALSAYLEESSDLVSIVDRLNVRTIKNTTDDRFITFFIGLYDAETSMLEYVNAGHNPPLILKKGKIMQLDVGGIFIGSLPWEYKSSSVKLEKGDLFVLFTDGLIEAMDQKKEEFGDERLEAIIEQSANLSPAKLLEEIESNVQSHIAGTKLEDDFTLVVVKKTA